MRSAIRRSAVAAIVLALTLALTGCSSTKGLANLSTWLHAQPNLTAISEPRLSTGSIGYAFNKRAVASATLRSGATSEDLRRLAGDLHSFMASGPGIKEVHLALTVGSDSLTLSGVPAEDTATLAAYDVIRADPSVTTVVLQRSWSPNGITEDRLTRARITHATAADIAAQLPAASAAVADLAPDVEAAWAADDRTAAEVVLATPAYAVSPATAAALAPAITAPGARVTLDQRSTNGSEHPRSVTVSVPEASAALDLHTALCPGGVAAFPDGFMVRTERGALVLHGVTAPTSEERLLLLGLLDAPSRGMSWSATDGLSVSLEEPLASAAPFLTAVPDTMPLELRHGGYRPTVTVSGTAAEVRLLHSRFGPLRQAMRLDQLVVRPGHLELVLPEEERPRFAQSARLVRTVGWEGAWQVRVATSTCARGCPDVTFTSTATGRAQAIDTSASRTRSSQDSAKQAEATARSLAAAWDATATP